MIFTINRSFVGQELKIANVVIEHNISVRYLEVIIDEKWSWSTHIATVKTKMAGYLGIIYKTRNFLPAKTRLQIYQYYSFVHSHLNYRPLVWGFAAKSHIDSVFSKQKSGIRAVMAGFVNCKHRDSIIPKHTKSNFNLMSLKSPKCHWKNALIFMLKITYFPN